jgi:hypothetical protein
MRILDESSDESRPLTYVQLHLTDDEARRAIEFLADCRHDLAEVGLSSSHVSLGSGAADAPEVTLYVYATEDELEAEVAERINEAS